MKEETNYKLILIVYTLCALAAFAFLFYEVKSQQNQIDLIKYTISIQSNQQYKYYDSIYSQLNILSSNNYAYYNNTHESLSIIHDNQQIPLYLQQNIVADSPAFTNNSGWTHNNVFRLIPCTVFANHTSCDFEGKNLRIIQIEPTGSMQPTISENDLLLVEFTDPKDIIPSDIMGKPFLYNVTKSTDNENKYILHRCVLWRDNGCIEKGDNTETNQASFGLIPRSQIVGIVRYRITAKV